MSLVVRNVMSAGSSSTALRPSRAEDAYARVKRKNTDEIKQRLFVKTIKKLIQSKIEAQNLKQQFRGRLILSIG